MLIIYSGTVGVFLFPSKEYFICENIHLAAAKKWEGSVIGDQGLLKQTKRGAWCIALENVKGMYLPATDYN